MTDAPAGDPQAPRVVIVGAGGHGRVVAEVLRLSGKATAAGFIDPDPALAGTTVSGLPVLGGDEALGPLASEGMSAVIGVGSAGPTHLRQRLRREVEGAGLRLQGGIHPSATVSPDAVIGAGTVVCAGAIIGPGTSIGRNVIVNTGAIVEHDCQVGDDSHVATGAVLAGGVRAGRGVHVGAGATVSQGVTLGDNAVAGAGAVVITSVAPDAVVVGVPARPLPTIGGK